MKDTNIKSKKCSTAKVDEAWDIEEIQTSKKWCFIACKP